MPTWNRRWPLFLEAEDLTIREIEKTIENIALHQNLSFLDAIRHIWMIGLERVAEDPHYGDKGLGTELRRHNALTRLKFRLKNLKMVQEAQKVLGREAVEEFGKQEKIDLSQYIAKEPPWQILSPFAGMKWWISEMLKDGQEHDVNNEIKPNAIIDGVIVDPEEDPHRSADDWNKLKVAASELGVSGGKRGKWQWPQQSAKD